MKTGVVLLKKGNLPQLELFGIASRLGKKFERRDSHFYVVNSPPNRFYQMAFAKVVGRYWFSFKKVSELAERTKKLREYVLKFPSFGVEGTMKRELGWWLEGRVDLSRPAQLLYVYKGRDKYHVLSDAKIIKGKDFSARDAKNRPFFHPSSMNARDARFLVNVGGVMPGDVVLDPFCGAGGILIEAGLLGARVIGVDIDQRMVKGCKRNLSHYGIKGEIILGDAREIDVEADVVVTDPPYGRSSRAPDDIKKLYLEAFENIHTLVRKRFVVVLPFEGEGILERAGFEVIGRARWFVHSSLTRRVYLCSP